MFRLLKGSSNGWKISLIVFCCFYSIANGQTGYSDKQHYSTVFQDMRAYRLYLPDSYHHMSRNYPVVYYFHGWGGRHFKDDNALLEYEAIKKLVDKYELILVMWDGNIERSEPRPYNIGIPEQVKYEVQMKDYFLELIEHIDTTFRTMDDRDHRGIIGYSMGGFMSFFLAGKYPHLVSAAVNLTGSPEFYVGFPDNHTLYPLRYTFANLSEVQIRMHNSSAGELSSLNREVHQGALHEPDLTYEYWEFEGGHKVDNPGETIVFEKAIDFISRSFQSPKPRDETWSHYDLYESFDVWGYEVETNKEQPGFLYLKGVSPSGFGFYTHQWLPDGPPLKNIEARLTTPPIYTPDHRYRTKVYDRGKGEITSSWTRSDNAGRLQFDWEGSGNEWGISEEGGLPNPTVLDYSINEGNRFIRTSDRNKLRIKMGNLGGDFRVRSKVKFEIASSDPSVTVSDYPNEVFFESGLELVSSPAISVSCSKPPSADGSPTDVKFRITMVYDTLTFYGEIEVPVFFNTTAFSTVKIDDGRLVRDSLFGKGNGDGLVAPGEEIMVYIDGIHRARLYTDDPWVEWEQGRSYEEALPAKWTENGITRSSIVRISEECPRGHQIKFLVSYETKEFMPITRNVHWGTVTLKVN